MKTSEAQKRAVLRYDQKNTKHYGFKLNRKTDADIIEYLDSVENVQGLIKELLRKEMSRG